ncbi:MAG: hypothetical protein OEM94_05230 [Acidimicrobiia bacterium]|nr:hypothetical protein [Acidimicrobiia bacterium]
MTTNPDPKYGRYILPFVIAGLVAATWIFVESLEPGTVPDGQTTTTTASAVSSTTTLPATSTTTTLPPVLASYIASVEGYVAESDGLLTRAREINANWEARSTSFGDTADALRLLATDTEDFATRVSEGATVPDLEGSHIPLRDAAFAMATAGQNMVTGLLDPDSAAGRVAAFEAYQLASDDLRAAFAAIQLRAGEISGTFSDSAPDEETTTTVSG